MLAKGVDARIVTRELRFGQMRVHRRVANVVEEHGRTALAALEFRDEVVNALFSVRRDWTLAQGTDRIALCFRSHLILAAA